MNNHCYYAHVTIICGKQCLISHLFSALFLLGAKHLNEDLEEQYHHSMEHRIAGGRKGHLGLGCHSDDDKVNKDDGSKEFVKPNDHEDNRQQVSIFMKTKLI